MEILLSCIFLVDQFFVYSLTKSINFYQVELCQGTTEKGTDLNQSCVFLQQ